MIFDTTVVQMSHSKSIIFDLSKKTSSPPLVVKIVSDLYCASRASCLSLHVKNTDGSVSASVTFSVGCCKYANVSGDCV